MGQEVRDKSTIEQGVQVYKSEETSPINARKISALTIIGDKVKNRKGEELGKIEEIVMDITTGTISYFVLSIGGFLGIGNRFYAVPLNALTINTEEIFFYLDVDKKVLKKSRGFDKQNWPEKPEWLF